MTSNSCASSVVLHLPVNLEYFHCFMILVNRNSYCIHVNLIHMLLLYQVLCPLNHDLVTIANHTGTKVFDREEDWCSCKPYENDSVWSNNNRKGWLQFNQNSSHHYWPSYCTDTGQVGTSWIQTQISYQKTTAKVYQTNCTAYTHCQSQIHCICLNEHMFHSVQVCLSVCRVCVQCVCCT